MYRINRDVYNVLDWLGDVGGLRDALLLIGSFVMFFHMKIRGNNLSKFLLQSFFVTERMTPRFYIDKRTPKDNENRDAALVNITKRKSFKI